MDGAEIRVRPLEDVDTEAASRLLVASITELCADDHGGDPALIAAWTANKTPARLRAWIAAGSTTLLLAEIGGRAAGVGACAPSGEILLTYVSPLFRGRGVGRTLLAAMERRLRARGVCTGRLVSTSTARGFYRGAGWIETGPLQPGPPVPGYPMEKRLAGAPDPP